MGIFFYENYFYINNKDGLHYSWNISDILHNDWL